MEQETETHNSPDWQVRCAGRSDTGHAKGIARARERGIGLDTPDGAILCSLRQYHAVGCDLIRADAIKNATDLAHPGRVQVLGRRELRRDGGHPVPKRLVAHAMCQRRTWRRMAEADRLGISEHGIAGAKDDRESGC
eukprot:3708133-Rhodomonas_salina.1